MGAKLTLETRFTSRTDSSESAQSRMKCIMESMSKESSIGVKDSDVDVSVEVPVGGASVGASTTIKGLDAKMSKGSGFKDDKYVSITFSTRSTVNFIQIAIAIWLLIWQQHIKIPFTKKLFQRSRYTRFSRYFW